MIVTDALRFRHLARTIALPLVVLFVWDVAVTIFYLKVRMNPRPLELPLSLFGTAIALFVGFVVNASYARWWEARGAWGAMTGASRNLGRQVLTFCADVENGVGADLIREIAHLQIAYVNLLRTSLRGEPIAPETMDHLPPGFGATLFEAGYGATALVTEIARRVGVAFRAGTIDAISRARIETTLVDMTAAQGGMERLKTTPLPLQYRVFPSLFAQVFCGLLPFAVVDDLGLFTPFGSTLVGLMFLMAVQIGRDLMDPFDTTIHCVPLGAICRTIEIDLLQMVGEPAPEKIAPVDGVLW